jgi:hypothetical protein
MSEEKITPWDVKKTANYLGRSPGAVRNLVLRRQIPFRKVGGRLVFLESEMQRWIKESPGLTILDIINK